MADVLRIKRRVTGAPGAPSSLANAEIAYNEIDHILYYGEGTAGAGGSATVVVGIAGQGMASALTPAMDGAPTSGVATTWSRGDHIHPVDTSRAPLVSPALQGTPTAPTVTPNTDASTKLATTAFVQSVVQAMSSGVVSITVGPGLTGGGTGAVNIGIAAAGITDAMLANMPAQTIKGNPAGTTASPADLTVAQTMTMLGAAPLTSPNFQGTPTAPVPANGVNTAQLATTSYVLSTRLDQFQPPANDVGWNNHKITGLLDPTNPNDAATKGYVDAAAQGIDGKESVRTASTGANITLTGTQTIDGVALVVGDRVLVKDQTTPAQNGIYVVEAAAWTRSPDANTWIELVSAFTFVESGTVNADNGWLCTADPGGTIGTTPVTWTQFSGAGQIIAGAGLVKTGNQIDVVGTANRILVNADNIDIAANYAGQNSLTTLGIITTGTWNGITVAVGYGGTGATNLTGYTKANGTNPFTASPTIPSTDVTGLGTMSTQNANAVAITGGTIDNIVLDMGVF
jgi:hypothetical protein